MTGKTHLETALGIGLLSGAALCAINCQWTNEWDNSVIQVSLPLLMGFVTGSIYPDADLATSDFVSSGDRDACHVTTGHRRFTHTLLGGICSSLEFLLIYLVLVIVTDINCTFFLTLGLSMFAGSLWHMYLDSGTEMGIMWGWPFSTKNIKLKLPMFLAKHENAFRHIFSFVCGLGAGIIYMAAVSWPT